MKWMLMPISSWGRIKSCYEYDWQGAELYFKRAIELNPGNSETHAYYELHFAGVGHIKEAIKEIKRVLERDQCRRISG